MIAGFNPWHWDDRRHQQATGPCDMALGAVNLTKTRAVLRNISHYIKTHAGGPKTDDDSNRPKLRMPNAQGTPTR